MILRTAALLVLAAALSGCVIGRNKALVRTDATGALAPGSRLDTSQEALTKAQQYFRNEDYGLAEVQFRKAVELNPNNKEAWIGLAALYDRLRRFDLAERAYKVVIQLVGYTLTVHNNLGYHYYLRGNLAAARKHFDAAYQLAPDNPLVRNNLKLVESS